MDTQLPHEQDNKPLHLILIAATLIGTWVALLIFAYLFREKIERLGQLGDTFGLLNCLFSGGAFALLIYTAGLQRKELALQRIEMRESRSELQGQKEQLALQNELTVLTGQIGLLPLMIAQEHRGLCIINVRFHTLFGEGNIASRDWDAQVPKVAAELRELESDLEKFLRIEHHQPAVFLEEVNNKKQLITQYKDAIERIEHLAKLTSELEQLRAKLAAKGNDISADKYLASQGLRRATPYEEAQYHKRLREESQTQPPHPA